MAEPMSRAVGIAGRGVVGLLGLAWAACFVLHLADLIGDRVAWVPIYVETMETRSATVVRGFWAGGAEHDGLRVGDLVVGIGAQIKPPEGPFDFIAQALTESREGRVPIRIQREGGSATLEVSLERRPWPPGLTLVSLAFGVMGIALLFFAAPSYAALLLAAGAFLYASQAANFFGTTGSTATLGVLALSGSAALYWPVFLSGLQYLAGSPVARLERAIPWLLLPNGVIVHAAVTGFPYGSPYGSPYAMLLFLAAQPLSIGVATWVLARSYRGAGPVERRQLRWIILGVSLATIPIAAAAMFSAVVPASFPLYSISLISTIAIPACCGIAILRTQLFDIDRAVGGTAAYAVVAVAIALIVEFGGEPLAGYAASLLGLPSSVGQTVLVIVLALFAQPAQARLKPRFERFLDR